MKNEKLKIKNKYKKLKIKTRKEISASKIDEMLYNKYILSLPARLDESVLMPGHFLIFSFCFLFVIFNISFFSDILPCRHP